MYKLSLRWNLLLMVSFFSLNLVAQHPLPVLETGAGPMPNEWIDNRTGHKIIKLTRRPGANNSFYFHNNPFMVDPVTKESKMIFFGIDHSIKNAFTVNLKRNHRGNCW
jgi:oligogalacturonide lyase